MESMFRRGGVWWARLVVPARLRSQAGRREFIQSTRTHDHAVGKLIATVLLAEWRRKLLEWERQSLDNDKLLRLVEASSTLSIAQHITVREASEATGLNQNDLMRAASSGKLGLFTSLGPTVRGHVLPINELELDDPALGAEGGVIVPRAPYMPAVAQEARFFCQTLRIPDSQAYAKAILADGLDRIEIMLLEAPNPAGWVFVPSETLHVSVDAIALDALEVEGLRLSLVARISPERLAHAASERKARMQNELLRAQSAAPVPAHLSASPISGKWVSKRFSEAVESYCDSPDGLPGTLASPIDQRQRKAGLLVFTEFMGDLLLSEIDGDVLRKFRDGPLKTIPGRVNTLPKKIKRETMAATIKALKADGREWPLLSDDMQRERMQWLFRLFEWMSSKGYLSPNPAASLRGETGLTKAERKAKKRTLGDMDDDAQGREPFSDEQLALIFGQLHYKTGNGKHVKKPAYWYGFEYWLPLLGLFSGLRIKEASQLHLQDVRQENGVWCLDINERTADKSLKNEQSTRLVPLHPELIRLGFLRYCERLRKEKFKRVFPELTWSTTNAKYAKESGRKMSNMLEKLGMPRDGTLVFHCLRHNANNAMRRVPVTLIPGADANLKQYMQYRIMGHEVGSDTNTRHYTSSTAAEMVALINDTKHNLPAIKEFDIDFALSQIHLALRKKSGNRKGSEDMGPLDKDTSAC